MLKMSEGGSNQVDLEKGLSKMSNDNDSSSPATMQKVSADMEESGSKIESPTPEKPESRREVIDISSLSRNFLAERYKDRFAEQLLGDEDETDDEDDNDSILPGGSQSSVSGSIDMFGASPNELLENDKHKNLLNLFNRMETSIRLLRLRKKMTTFKNIAAQVEVLAKRKFLYTHLAQMKHLFPEAIQINRILLHDENSLCMYADMEITLLMDAVICRNPDQSPSMAICEAFHSKLSSFLESHHKGINVPEAILPEPFNSREKLYPEAPHNGHSVEPLLQSSSENGFSNVSHFPQSFQKLMSQKIISEGTERTQLLSDPEAVSCLSADDTEGPNRSSNKHASIPVKTDISATPKRHLISSGHESTPKQCTSSSPLMAETPAMQTPKRSLPTPVEKLENTSGHISETRSTSSARRSLVMFSPAKFEESPSDHDADTSKLEKDESIFNAKHEVTAEKCLFPEESCTFTNSLVENDKDRTNQVPTANSQEKLDSLRVTFDIVCHLSGSAKNSVITKQELFHNILANNLEIEETGEIEEQLHILEDLSPDWISKKVVRGGEILYSIKQIPDKKLVRERLVEAI